MRPKAPSRRPPPTTGSHGWFWPVSARRAGATFGPPIVVVAAPTPVKALPWMVAARPPTLPLVTNALPAAPPVQLPSVAATLTVFWITPAGDVGGIVPEMVSTMGGSPGWYVPKFHVTPPLVPGLTVDPVTVPPWSALLMLAMAPPLRVLATSVTLMLVRSHASSLEMSTVGKVIFHVK